MDWSKGKAIYKARKSLGLSQKQLGDKLKVTSAHISTLEADRQDPSKILVELMRYAYNISPAWVFEGKGEPFLDKANTENFNEFHKKEKTARNVLLLGVVLGPVLPTAAAGLAIGVGAAQILDKMRKAYGANNITELARNHLKIDSSAVSHWTKQNKIPGKYIQKSINDTEQPLEYFLTNDEIIEEGVCEVLSFIKEQIEEVTKEPVDTNKLKENFTKRFEYNFVNGGKNPGETEPI